MLYKCDCGDRLCKIHVSRSTRYRHRLAKTLLDTIARGPPVNDNPLPVEDDFPDPGAPAQVLHLKYLSVNIMLAHKQNNT